MGKLGGFSLGSAQLERDLGLISPALFALVTSRGRWQMARHLAYLDQAILEARK